MVIDEAYLNSPDTVYPVTVDPSFTIDGSRHSDTTIYTNYSKTDWKNGSMFAGNYNKRFPEYDRGTARALVRVPYWYDGLINLQTSQINSVKLDLSDLYPGNPPNTISVYKMNEYWDDLSAVCSDKLWDGYDKTALTTRVFKWGNRDYVDDNGVHHYLVDITKAVKDWKDGKTTDNGLMLKAEDESIAARVFGTVDGNYPLNLEVSYGYKVKINESDSQLTVGDQKQLTVSEVPAPGAGVNWSSSNPEVATVASNGKVTAKSPGITQITATSKIDSNAKSIVAVSVIDEYSNIFQTLSRGEYYYIMYAPNISPWSHANAPASPFISTFTFEQKLKSVQLTRPYSGEGKVFFDKEATQLQRELNDALGLSLTKADVYQIKGEYDLATATVGMPPLLYTPESVERCINSYTNMLNVFMDILIFRAAFELNYFDSNGNIKFRPDKDFGSKCYTTEGRPIYPPNDGFAGERYSTTIEKDKILSRFGTPGGTYVSPDGTPFGMRALPGRAEYQIEHRYKVKKPITCEGGLASPWFGQPGGGIQYKLPHSVEWYVKNKYLEELF